MASDRVIGIDLGTTNSCAAVVEGLEQRVKLIPYRGGEYTIPSIYAIDDKGNELVGHEAKRQWQLNPRRTVYGSKRLLGRQYDPELVDKMHEYFAYDIVESPDKSEVTIPLNGQPFTLQQISAKLLQKIRDVASEYLQAPVKRAVVTVPAYFNDRQRQAVREAGTMVDLDIIRIINEPTAAALAFGVGRELEQETVAIFDLGGGTFDISIVEIRDRVFEVKATGGDIFLGGVDYDNRVVDWVVSEFAKSHPDTNLRNDPVAMQRIRDTAERSKIDLSNRKEVPFRVPFVTLTAQGQPLDIDLKLTREMFEALTQDLLERTIETCRRVCEDAGMAPTAVDNVLLVGGMTRMPRVQEAVTDFFGKQPSKQVNPDEAVAIGAAMFAYSFQDDSNLRVQVLDVIPMAIGIEDAEGRLHEIFKRNESVPNLKTLTFTTSQDDQETLEMRIYQGDERQARQNELLGEFTFSGIRVAERGKVRVEVIFQLTQEGILEMSARDRDTGIEMKTTVNLGVRKGD
ncbi:MAG: Hsp70 family protein [Deltaproteobacteria bacterium]|nr:Hsp70 family protein [Deltaproteobacteria bacterium]